MSVEAPAVGDRLRVTERAIDGSTRSVTQGTVIAVDATNNRIDFGATKTKLTSTAQVDVRIEALWADLPTTPGSFVKIQGASGVMTFFLTESGWIAKNGIHVGTSWLQRNGAVVVFATA